MNTLAEAWLREAAWELRMIFHDLEPAALRPKLEQETGAELPRL